MGRAVFFVVVGPRACLFRAGRARALFAATLTLSLLFVFRLPQQRRLSEMPPSTKASRKGSAQGTLDRMFGLTPKKPKLEAAEKDEPVEKEAPFGATDKDEPAAAEAPKASPLAPDASASPVPPSAVGADLDPSDASATASLSPLPPASPSPSTEPPATSAAAAAAAVGSTSGEEERAQPMATGEGVGEETVAAPVASIEEGGNANGPASAPSEGDGEAAGTASEAKALESASEDEGDGVASTEASDADESDASDDAESASDSESADATFVPSDLLKEESRLRVARERDAGAGAAQADPLGSARFQQLEALLTQSKLYTEFLVEQMAEAEAELDQAAAEAESRGRAAAAAAAADAKKAAGAKRAKKGAKRGKRGQESVAGVAGASEGDTPGAPLRPAAPGSVSSAAPLAPGSGGLDLVAATASLCPGLTTPLRDYQLRGVRWMISLYQNGINGILADQMGLGKTLQTIGLICHLRSKGVLAPYLVLGPLSTLSNWIDEFARHAPGVPTVLYHGSKEKRAALAKTLFARPPTAASPVVVTSYEIAIADAKKIAKWQYKYLVVDEGHRLKNPSCKLLRELKTIQADNRLLLTGTPLQNNLTELWSLLNFILPQVFASLSDFGAWFDQVGDEEEDEDDEDHENENESRDAPTSAENAASASRRGGEAPGAPAAAPLQRRAVAARLHAVLKPFLLRRVKDDVEASLPGKMEILLYAPMTDAQRRLDALLRARGGVAKAHQAALEKRSAAALRQGQSKAGAEDADAEEQAPRQRKRRRNELEALRASNAVWGDLPATGATSDVEVDADSVELTGDDRGAAAAAASASAGAAKTRRGRSAAGRALLDASGVALSSASSSSSSSSSAPSLTQLRNTLMQLRKVCNHPDLVSGTTDGSLTLPSADESVAQCGKMRLLDRLMLKLINGGHRVLIFSQMTAVLDLISAYLDERGLAHVRLDGAMPWDERKDAIQRFNDARTGVETHSGADAGSRPAPAPHRADPRYASSPLPDPGRFPHVFLLSTRAGGLGINLTSADTAIIYDSDWNPHQDLQAMDRCHRIGQTRPVLVLRLATARSVEGKMLRRARQKLDLERVVIKRGAFLHDQGKGKRGKKGTAPSAASREELLDMLRDDEGGAVGNSRTLDAKEAQGQTQATKDGSDAVGGGAKDAERDFANTTAEPRGSASASASTPASAAVAPPEAPASQLPGGSLLRHGSGTATVDPQSDVVDDATLDALLDRSHLEGKGAKRFGEVGVGFEVVAQAAGSGMLSGVE